MVNTPAQTEATMQSKLRRIRSIALVVGVTGLAVSFVGAAFDPTEFFVAYLIGYLYWLGLSLGCFAVAMLHHLTGGRWGFVIRRFLEAGFMTLPIMALLFIPLLFGLHELYPWARPTFVAADEVLQKRVPYMSYAPFGARALAAFCIWIAVAWLLRKWSLEQDRRDDAAPTRRIRRLSGPAILLHPIVATFVFVDWIMSTEPHWYSTVFVIIVLVGQLLNTIAFMILLLAWFNQFEPISGAVTSTHYHHLGNLLLAFVMFWTYVAFSQLLIVYSGNQPHTITWYLHRIEGGWKAVIAMIALFHFFLPFFLLLFRRFKTDIRPLAWLAGMIFVAHFADMYWMIKPSYAHAGFAIHWLNVIAPVAVGGLWIATFLFALSGKPLLPQRDPGRLFSVTHEY